MSAKTLRCVLSQHIRVLPARIPSRSLIVSYTQQHKHFKTSRYRASYSTSRTTASTATSSPEIETEMSEPTGLIAKSGIELLTFGTPNGVKISVLLEELKEAYGKEYTWQGINIMKNTQKEPWFTALNPNGRIPVVVDHDRNGFAVFEGMAILSYLTRHYDPEHKFSFPVDSDEYSEAEQWMAWQHGGIGPMQGQANHFFRFAKEKIPYAVQRYVGESERLYGILDKRLENRDFIVGPGRGKYSIADINLLGWVSMGVFSGLDIKMFPNVDKWVARCHERPAVQKGFDIPFKTQYTNDLILKAREEDPEAKKQAEESLKFLNEAKEKYGYKYSSP
ncbi:glutathione S-transferase [Hypomontagnella monticulosa]|nr:glutathione S-transferase [Hypomontagnella monticulosa]